MKYCIVLNKKHGLADIFRNDTGLVVPEQNVSSAQELKEGLSQYLLKVVSNRKLSAQGTFLEGLRYNAVAPTFFTRTVDHLEQKGLRYAIRKTSWCEISQARTR